jgi:hypothetical protein
VLANYGELFTLRNGNIIQKLSFLLLTVCQVLLYAAGWCSPAYFVLALNAAIKTLLDYTASGDSSYISYYQDVSMYIFLTVFAVFLLLHVFMIERKVVRWILDIATILCSVVVVIILCGLIVQPLINGVSVLWCLFIATLAFPYILSACQSKQSLIIMLKTTPVFLLWSPTFVVFVTFYSLSRLWELTW